LTGLINYKKTNIKIIKASILTGALLFSTDLVFSQDSLIVADILPKNDSLLLVKKDTSPVQAASLDTTFAAHDSLNIAAIAKKMKKNKLRSPIKAGLYSAIVPGLGQAYNHKYWKIPFIYVGGGILISVCDYYNNYYNEYLDLYNKEVFNPKGTQNNKDNYARIRDEAGRRRNRFILYTGLLYVANVVDAVVDAYFSEFDISDDLSLKVRPAMAYSEYAMGNFSYGMSIQIKF
jgi:hypothetical protein